MRNVVLSCMVFTVVLSACNKHADYIPREELISSKSSKGWKTTAILINDENIFDIQDDCDRDDIQHFFADGKYEADEGASKCDPDDPQIFFTGTWALIDGDTKFVTIADGIVDTADVIRLTNNNFDIRTTEGGIVIDEQMEPN